MDNMPKTIQDIADFTNFKVNDVLKLNESRVQ